MPNNIPVSQASEIQRGMLRDQPHNVVVANAARQTWGSFLPRIYLVALLAYCCLILFAHFLVLANKNVIQCAQIYTDQNGQFKCIDWNLQRQPIVGARVIKNVKVESHNMKDRIRVYIDSNHQYFVASSFKHEQVQILKTYDGIMVETHGYVGYSMHGYGSARTCTLLDTETGMHCAPTDLDFVQANHLHTWSCLLYFATFSKKLPQSKQCVVSEDESQLVVDGEAFWISDSDMKFLKKLAHTKHPTKRFIIADRVVSITLNFSSQNKFRVVLTNEALSTVRAALHERQTCRMHSFERHSLKSPENPKNRCTPDMCPVCSCSRDLGKVVGLYKMKD